MRKVTVKQGVGLVGLVALVLAGLAVVTVLAEGTSIPRSADGWGPGGNVNAQVYDNWGCGMAPRPSGRLIVSYGHGYRGRQAGMMGARAPYAGPESNVESRDCHGWGCDIVPGSEISGTVPYGCWNEGWQPGMGAGLGCDGWPSGITTTLDVSGTMPYGCWNEGRQPGMEPGWGCGGWRSGIPITPGITGTVPYGCSYGPWGDPEGNGWGASHGWRMRGGPWEPKCGYPSGNAPDLAPDGSATPKAPEDVSFDLDVQPILSANCVGCHGSAGGLSLEGYEGLMRGGASGPAIIPGDPSASRLIQYLRSGYMPYRGRPLAQAQIQTLADWVAAGAPDN